MHFTGTKSSLLNHVFNPQTNSHLPYRSFCTLPIQRGVLLSCSYESLFILLHVFYTELYVYPCFSSSWFQGLIVALPGHIHFFLSLQTLSPLTPIQNFVEATVLHIANGLQEAFHVYLNKIEMAVTHLFLITFYNNCLT